MRSCQRNVLAAFTSITYSCGFLCTPDGIMHNVKLFTYKVRVKKYRFGVHLGTLESLYGVSQKSFRTYVFYFIINLIYQLNLQPLHLINQCVHEIN